MSADSPRRLSRKGSAGHVVLPQTVSDPSIIDSVAGFIHEVIPQAYSSVLPGDTREAIAWARFEQADYNDPILYPDTADDCDATAPLLLVLGYANGVQVWSIPASGEAVEVLSWNQRIVRALRFLPAPDSQPSQLRCDPFAHKRPLVALVDNAGSGPHFCSVSFISLHGGDQVKSVKFKNPIADVLANRRSIVITFPERIAVFDALNLEDRLTVTTCYPSPGICLNPVSLGARWLAYADKRLVSWWRSQGGCEGDSAQSYTATVLHAAKSLGKGLRGLSGSVASSLTGTGVAPNMVNGGETSTPGIVTILDIEGHVNSSNAGSLGENVIAHFVAHCDPIVALSFDPSGMLLLTVDKRGHRFHLFRIQPHPSGSSLSEVHQLYTLHRGDTTARIQDITFSSDSRWVAVSSLRGTTHVFPVTPYGGSIGVRTHTTPHVVNRLSRFHRSAGLSDEGGRNSPVAHDGPPLTPPLPPRSLPTPHAITVQALAQLRHQAVPPTSEDAMVRLTACFAPPRACLPGLSNVPAPIKNTRRALDSLYIMSCHGNLIQYDLDPRHISGVSKDRICDDTAIELIVDPKAEWILMMPPLFNPLQPPLSPGNPLLISRSSVDTSRHTNCVMEKTSQNQDERWLSQVEIVTHAGPHRRLWMGPQFTFKTYNLTTGDVERESIEVGTIPAQSNPINVPMRPPLLIESGSTSSLEQSPHLTEVYQNEFEHTLGHGESRLREDLADAMLESPNVPGTRSVWVVGGTKHPAVVERLVNPLGTVIMIDPDRSRPVADLHASSHDPSSVADHLIVVPAESSTAPAMRQQAMTAEHPRPLVSNKQKHKSDVEVPDCKNVPVPKKCSNIYSSCIDDVVNVKDKNEISLDKLSKNSPERELLDGSDKTVGKTNNKEKRKNAKNDRNKIKRYGESVESNSKIKSSLVLENVKSDDCVILEKILPTETVEEKPSTTTTTACIILESNISAIEGSKSARRRSRHSKKIESDTVEESNKKNELEDSIVNLSLKEEKLDEIALDSCSAQPKEESLCADTVETISETVSAPQSDLKIEESNVATDDIVSFEIDGFSNLNEQANKEKVSFSSKVSKTRQRVDEKFSERNLPESGKRADVENETRISFSEPVVIDKKIEQCEDSTQIESTQSIKDKEYPTLTASIKNKRKCKTLGKKITKVTEEKPCEKTPESKVDEIDLLDCQQSNQHNLMEFPDLVLSNVKTSVDKSDSENFDDLNVKDGSFQDTLDTECITHEETDQDVTEMNAVEQPSSKTVITKSQNDETTDKDSSDDSQGASSPRSDSKGSGQKKRKSTRKQRETDLEGQSDSDTNNDKLVSLTLTAKCLDDLENSAVVISGNEESSQTPEIKEPKKMSWSRIVSMGKEDANGNFTKQDIEESVQPEIISWSNVTSRCLEKEAVVKTNSTEDRGSVYESCSESVGEESEQQCQAQVTAAEDMNDLTMNESVNEENTEKEVYKSNVDSGEKESADSGEKESADSGEKDNVQQASKKSRKQRKKRR